MSLTRRDAAGLAVVLVAYLFLCARYATQVPIWNAPDEPAHYNYIRAIAVDHELPILRMGDYDVQLIGRLTSEHFPPGTSIDAIRYEFTQPPLYYALATPIFLALGRAPVRTQVIALRLFTSLIGAVFLVVTFLAVGLLFPKQGDLRLATTAFVAFLPMHVFMAAAIDNDALAELALALVVLGVLLDWRAAQRSGTLSWRRDVVLGALVGIAILAKVVASIAVVLVVVGFLATAWLSPGRGATLRRVPLRCARSGLVAAIVGGWWIVRNLIVYGPLDPFGLRRHAEVVVGQPLTGAITLGVLRNLALTAFHSYWGQFGWMGIPYQERTYDVLTAWTLFVLIGFALFVVRITREPGALALYQRLGLALLGVELVLVLVGVFGYNVRYLQPQGRYLFPALPALALFAVLGLRELLADCYRSLLLGTASIVLFGFAYWSLVDVIRPAFAGN